MRAKQKVLPHVHRGCGAFLFPTNSQNLPSYENKNPACNCRADESFKPVNFLRRRSRYPKWAAKVGVILFDVSVLRENIFGHDNTSKNKALNGIDKRSNFRQL